MRNRSWSGTRFQHPSRLRPLKLWRKKRLLGVTEAAGESVAAAAEEVADDAAMAPAPAPEAEPAPAPAPKPVAIAKFRFSGFACTQGPGRGCGQTQGRAPGRCQGLGSGQGGTGCRRHLGSARAQGRGGSRSSGRLQEGGPCGGARRNEAA